MKSNSTDILEYVFNKDKSALIILDRNFVIQKFNQQAVDWAQLFFSKEIRINAGINDYIDPEDHPEFEDAFESIIKKKIHSAPIVSIVTRGAEELWYETIITPLGDPDGLILLTITDISLRKKTFDAISESEMRFKSLIQYSSGIIMTIDSEGVIIYISESVKGLLGYQPSECKGKNICSFMHESKSAEFDKLLHKLKNEEWKTFSREAQFVNSTGDSLYFDLKGSNQTMNPVIKGIIINLNDITDRIYADEMFNKIAHKNELILETASEGIFGLNNIGSFTFINPFMLEMLKYSYADLIGNNVSLILPENSDIASRILNHTMVQNAEVLFKTKDGSTLPVMFSSTPIFENNVKTGTVVTFNDISLRKRAEQELIAAKNDAEKANNAKSEFLAIMSHEIRTPMNNILGFLELMSHDDMNNSQKEYLSIASSNAAHLIRIINEILDLSKIEKGKLELEIISFNPVDEISAVIALFGARAAEKNIALTFLHGSCQNCKGDPTRYRQVVTNLISNAVKFTPVNGNISVAIECSTTGNNSVKIHTEVKDNGQGIPQDKLERIFESFTQSDISIARRYGGTGLGLSISAKIVELMGGKLSVESELGKWSKFYFDIVLPATAENKVCITTTGSFQKMNLHALLAEDVHDTVKFMTIMLDRLGISCDSVSTGSDAVKMFQLNKYDLILMDGNMPEMNGVEAIYIIREIEKNLLMPKTPIIALSAHAMKTERDEFILSGADDLIVKPVSLQSLFNSIRSVVFKTPILLQVNNGERKKGLHFVAENLGVPEAKAKELMESFITSMPEYIKDIRSAVDHNDENALICSIHRLKGVSRTYGFEGVASLCESVESRINNVDITQEDKRNYIAKIDAEYLREKSEMSL